MGVQPTIIDGFRAQAAAVSIGVRAAIERTIAESANLVIDGVSIVPDLLALDQYRELAEVIVLLIATREEDVLRGRFHARAIGEGRRTPHRYIDHLEAILEIQRHLLELAEQCEIPVIDNTSFDHASQAVVDRVMATLRSSSRITGVS